MVLTYLAQLFGSGIQDITSSSRLRSDATWLALKDLWPTLIRLSATSHDARSQLCTELEGLLLTSQAARSDQARPWFLEGPVEFKLNFLWQLLFTNEHDLLQYLTACVGDEERYCVAGGYALRTALQYEWHLGETPWDDGGDIDVFFKCSGDIAARSTNRQRLDEATEETVQFFQRRGYEVETKRASNGSALSLLPLPSNMAQAMEPFTVQELKTAIAEPPDYLKRSHITDFDDDQQKVFASIVEHIPAVRRRRDWLLARAELAGPGGAHPAQMYITVTNPINNQKDVINLIGMAPRDANHQHWPIARVARDFDLAQCSVSVTAAADGANGTLAFGGSPEALALARAGTRQMRLTEFSFEPILPLDESDVVDGMDAEHIRSMALELAVVRQMTRIAKYIYRGYTWA